MAWFYHPELDRVVDLPADQLAIWADAGWRLAEPGDPIPLGWPVRLPPPVYDAPVASQELDVAPDVKQTPKVATSGRGSERK